MRLPRPPRWRIPPAANRTGQPAEAEWGAMSSERAESSRWSAAKSSGWSRKFESVLLSQPLQCLFASVLLKFIPSLEKAPVFQQILKQEFIGCAVVVEFKFETHVRLSSRGDECGDPVCAVNI